MFPTVSPEAYPAGPDGVRGALWRSLAVFRWVAFGYAAIAAGVRLRYADRPVLGLALIVVMTAWSAALTVVTPTASRSRPRLLRALALADLAVCAALVVGAELVGPRSSHALPMIWAISGVFGAALVWGTLGGVVGGLLIAAAFFAEWGTVTDSLVRTTLQVLLAGAVTGYLTRTALRAEAAVTAMLAARAADAQRARLARAVHDGVLQVLALIAREAPRGLPADQVARLAAEQESVLRDLLRVASPGEAPVDPISPDTAGAGARTDLAELLVRLVHPPAGSTDEPLGGADYLGRAGAPRVTVATPGVPVPLATHRAAEVVAAVRAALDNVARHAGPAASAWVLVEDDGDEVLVTIRDDGVGIAPGRADEAAAAGRLGLAVSIRGRVRDLGGDVTVLGGPGLGTEVELRVPR
ncbi:MacS family sensor histidine kinase [Pseudofrankia inefficax]|uniref:Putative signal transduction histidine kinase n=1 Tax=Pseudofrankia inefficax (strain DSM 45817 / CECT 9037 / DDB 130130 / EuI1c) TaxID=298654 RepID=E3J2A7_PSEI1|nr:ATP-binding protein [Pseudofrankia inefficax]ADP79279.1 putative signal transduction histidine kinase [Pseudofrankia inefficax]